jgi:hypothetical protein
VIEKSAALACFLVSFDSVLEVLLESLVKRHDKEMPWVDLGVGLTMVRQEKQDRWYFLYLTALTHLA